MDQCQVLTGNIFAVQVDIFRFILEFLTVKELLVSIYISNKEILKIINNSPKLLMLLLKYDFNFRLISENHIDKEFLYQTCTLTLT